jgi:WD40 repeat protein
MNTPRIVGPPVALLASLILSACGGGEPSAPAETGVVSVSAATTGGDLDLDGYTVEISGKDGQYVQSRAVARNGSTLFPNLTAGQYRLQLSGIESNCAVVGQNPRTVSVAVGQTTTSTFNVACVAVTDSLEVWTRSCGSHIDQDGYTISIDGVVRDTIGVNTTYTLYVEGLGEHTISLGDVASECVLCGGNTRVFEVTRPDGRDDVIHATLFPVLCNPDLTGTIAFVRFGPTFCDWTCWTPSDIYLLGPEQQCPLRLTNSPNTMRVYGAPALSPDGAKIAFVSHLVTLATLYVMNADGTAVISLEQDSASGPSWSPDGARITFSMRSRQGDIIDSDIYLIDADGTDLVNLTGHLGTDDTAPAWSPDGGRIAFASGGDLFVIDVDGTNLTRLTLDTERNDDPAWSPDAARIAFSCEREGNWEICVMNADGTGLRQLTNDPANDYGPVWSPDGAKIAFTRDDNTVFYYSNLHRTVFFMNPDGSDVKPFIDRARAPTWSRAQ